MWQAVLIVGSLLVGQEPAVPSGALTGQVARLIRQLDDDRPDNRQAAEAALIELGPDVLELLPATDAVASAEVRERLTRVRGRLQTERSRRSVEASLVSLDGDMTLAEALHAIQQQTGNALLGYEDLDQRVTIHWPQVPFWEALDQVLDEGHLTIDPFAGDRRGLMIRRARLAPLAGHRESTIRVYFVSSRRWSLRFAICGPRTWQGCESAFRSPGNRVPPPSSFHNHSTNSRHATIQVDRWRSVVGKEP